MFDSIYKKIDPVELSPSTGYWVRTNKNGAIRLIATQAQTTGSSKINKIKKNVDIPVSIYFEDDNYEIITGTVDIDLSSNAFTFFAYKLGDLPTFNLSLYKKNGDEFEFQTTITYNQYGYVTIDDLQLLSIGEYKLVAGEQGVEEVASTEDNYYPNHLFFNVTGERFNDNLEIKEGWNLISSSTDIECDIIDSDNIIENNIYSFSNISGYIEITTFKLLPSTGYWIKSKSNGDIRLIGTPGSSNYQVSIRATRQVEEVQKTAIKTTKAISSSRNVIKDAMSGPSDGSRASYQSFIKKMQSEFSSLSIELDEATTAIETATDTFKSDDNDNIQALNKVVSSCSTKIKYNSDFSNIASEFANDYCSNNGGDDENDAELRIKKNRKKSNKRIYTGYDTDNPLVKLNKAIVAFDDAKSNFKYTPTSENYDVLESANDNVISALKDVVNQTAAAGNDQTEAQKLVQSIKANNSKGKPLENGEYTIVDLKDWDWGEIQNSISITIRNKYEILNEDYNYILDKELIVNHSNWLKGSYVWDSTNKFYVNETDTTKFIKFLKYNTDSDEEDDIIRVVTSDAPDIDGSQDSLVYLNETKPSILLEDGYYNIKIKKSDEQTIASIPKFLEDNQYQFTVRHKTSSWDTLEFFNSNLNLLYTFTKEHLGNAIIYTEDIPHSYNDELFDYVPDYGHKPLSIDFLEDGTLVLVNITDEYYGETYKNPPDYYYIGTWEKVDDLSKMSNNRLYKNSSNNYYYVPLNSNGLYLIYFQDESDLSKYDFLNKTIKSSETLPIYQFHGDKGVYINHNDINKTFDFSDYTETPIIFNFEREQYYYGGQILSQFADISKYTIHLYGVDGYKINEPQNVDRNNPNFFFIKFHF